MPKKTNKTIIFLSSFFFPNKRYQIAKVCQRSEKEGVSDTREKAMLVRFKENRFVSKRKRRWFVSKEKTTLVRLREKRRWSV